MPAAGSSARRYAQAVFDIAREQNRLEQWREDLQSLVRAASVPTAVAFLRNPRVPVEVKRQVLTEALPGISEEAVNLAALLISRGRLEALLAAIAEDYNRLLDVHAGILRAQVTTAVALDPAQQQQISATLATSTGKQVRMEHRVDPKIIGGMVIRLDNRVIDGSIRNKLTGLRRNLTEMMA